MSKFFIFVSSFLLAGFLSLLEPSGQNNHSFFYLENENVFDKMKEDRSFKNLIPFWIIQKIQHKGKIIHQGEYDLRKNETCLEFLIKLITNKSLVRKITFPEGMTVKRMIEDIANNDLLFGKIEYLPLEGSLLPNTYFYKFGDSKKSIISKMKNAMEKVVLDIKKKNKTNLSWQEILVMGSMIESEAANNQERNLISAVFHNRLKIKMRLQSDPTVAYFISNGYGRVVGGLNRKHFYIKSPFNTYRFAGLPPTPICCPGLASIEAAMNPAPNDFLYFVVNKHGSGHVFSKDFNSHLKNVESYKKSIR